MTLQSMTAAYMHV